MRSLAVCRRPFFVLLMLFLAFTGSFGCGVRKTEGSENREKRVAELAVDEARRVWVGQCWFDPIPTVSTSRCGATFVYCQEPWLVNSCQLLFWVWCGQYYLFQGDFSHTSTGHRMLMFGAPIIGYNYLPMMALFARQRLPYASSPATLHYRNQTVGGFCQTGPGEPGDLPATPPGVTPPSRSSPHSESMSESPSVLLERHTHSRHDR